ncbi:protein ACCELERATED CELL DEATH 6-like [Prosopis cineraria]|uniref:protein ACCELERATED CELL DEATH 6-like n=1 Tax=Prosopis cineraria TaxID=364024 RepID=UPI00240FC9BF|nr:protein ACCELERATED CELL DEATH 6-like [Prosopis cineraria]
MEAKNSNWKTPCYEKLQELIKKWFSASDNQIPIGLIEDTMSHELYNAVPTPTGDSLLHVAAEYGRERIVELLVDNNFSLVVTNNRKDTAIHVAARAKNIGVMRVILSKFDDASNEDVRILHRLLQIPFPSGRVIHKSHGNSPLHAAISESNITFLKNILHEKEGLMYFRDEHRNTPLHYAAYIGYVEGVHELLNKSNLVAFQQNSNGDLLIHIACQSSRVQVVKQVLRLECPYTRFWLNNKGQNILHIAAENGQNKMCRASMILRTTGVPLRKDMLGVQCVANIEWNVNYAANTLILGDVLIAIVTFAAGFTVPSRVYSSNDSIPKNKGIVVLVDKKLFKFMAFNTISMYSSIFGSIVLLWMHLGDRRYAIRAYFLARLFAHLALRTMPVAFMAAIYLVIGYFPLGNRILLLRRIGELIFLIGLILFYGPVDRPHEVHDGEQLYPAYGVLGSGDHP